MNIQSHVRRYARLITIGAAALAALIAVSATLASTARTHAHSTPPGLGNLPQPANSNVSLTQRDLALLRDVADANPGFVTGAVQLLKASGTTSFYRIVNTAGAGCFALGSTPAAGQVLGAVECVRTFPSAESPVLDFTIMHGNPGSPDTRVWRSSGFAADNIATIAFSSTDGSLSSRTPVVNNIFDVTDLPTVQITAIVGLDASGNTVWSKPLS